MKLRAANTKGRRGMTIYLHPVVIEHLETIRGFNETVFHWPHYRRTLDAEFHAIQKAAGIPFHAMAITSTPMRVTFTAFTATATPSPQTTLNR